MTLVEIREIQAAIDRIKLNHPASPRDNSLFKNSHEIIPNSQRLNTGSEPYCEWTCSWKSRHKAYSCR